MTPRKSHLALQGCGTNLWKELSLCLMCTRQVFHQCETSVEGKQSCTFKIYIIVYVRTNLSANFHESRFICAMILWFFKLMTSTSSTTADIYDLLPFKLLGFSSSVHFLLIRKSHYYCRQSYKNFLLLMSEISANIRSNLFIA